MPENFQTVSRRSSAKLTLGPDSYGGPSPLWIPRGSVEGRRSLATLCQRVLTW